MSDRYHYTECGLDHVFLCGLNVVVDDNEEEVVGIPNINQLHKAIASEVIAHSASLSGPELRFLRTELGMTQAELARIVHRENLAVSRWERGELPIDENADIIIRMLACEKLDLGDCTISELTARVVPSADNKPINIDGSDPQHYRPMPTAA